MPAMHHIKLKVYDSETQTTVPAFLFDWQDTTPKSSNPCNVAVGRLCNHATYHHSLIRHWLDPVQTACDLEVT